MKRWVPFVRMGLVVGCAACTGATSSGNGNNANPPPAKRADDTRPTVVPAEHHDRSPPLREIPPAPRPPDDMKREIPIHRLPIP